MRLSKIDFTNFRSFKSETIHFDNYTSLVGPNNCGKSTVLRALNIFYGGMTGPSRINENDFYIGCDKEDVLSIKLEFDQVVGDEAEALRHYVRSSKVAFEIVAIKAEGQVNSKCRGIRFGLEEFIPFFAAKNAAEKKPIYESLRENYSELAPWKSMLLAQEAIEKIEADRANEHIAIPSEENAYGTTGPVPILKKYLDWIYVPAVKDVTSEASEQRNSAFSKLIMLAVRAQYDFSKEIAAISADASKQLDKVLVGAAEVLKKVGNDIDREFKNLTSTPIDVSLSWSTLEEIIVKEPSIKSLFTDGSVQDAPENFGHGLQRTYLMALLSLAARTQTESQSTNIILGIEEPELYQHPPQARFLANALYELSASNCQVIVTTHSPSFITGRTFENIRVLRKSKNVTKVYNWTIDEQRAYHAARKEQNQIGSQAALSGIDKTLQTNISEMFFASKVILVEGHEDCALIEAYLKQIGKYSEFLRAGCHIVSVNGKNKMPMMIAMARGFSIDAMCVFDFDNKTPLDASNKELTRYAEDVGILFPETINTDYSSKYFFGYANNIQSSIEEVCPDWKATKLLVAEEWGWTASHMEKDPMLLAEIVRRVCTGGATIAPMENLVCSMEQFWLDEA